MKAFRGLTAIAFVAISLAVGAAPADAALTGPCTATATINGKNYDARTIGGQTVTVPRRADVHWNGAVRATGPRAVAGHVRVKMPWPIPALEIGTWGPKTSKSANSGVYHYDLPKQLAGVDIPVSGAHSDKGGVCAGLVVVRIDGGGISNLAVIGAFVVLILSGLGLWVALLPKGA